MSRLPTYFISHGGGPCFFMDWDPPDAWTALGDSLRRLPEALPSRPRAVVMVSAHWEAPEFRVTGHPQPSLIYDYHGFPPHTYELKYPAPGEPALAADLVRRLQQAGLSAGLDPSRGYDHGLFIPALLMFPRAEIPMVQVSLRADLDPAAHLACGRALAGLRDEGVLIVGSGYSYHNLRAYGAAGAPTAAVFDAWLQAQCCGRSGADRSAALSAWAQVPSARLAHPREEHLIPLLVAAAAAEDAPGTSPFSEPVLGIQTSAFRFG